MRFPHELPVSSGVVRADDIDVPVTNLDKVFWPDDGITKGDLLTYYFNVAETILPYLHDRPLTLKRFPNGVNARYFFQKDAPDYTPDWVELCAIEPEDTKIDETVMVNKLADLLFVANLGCIEMHPLHSRCERYDLPDYLVVDLDPMEPATFKDAVAVAHHVRTVLDVLELEGYVKTSGATGLQIYVPVKEKHSYEETRAVAEKIGMAIVKADPDRATMEWDIARRSGKVFIDHKMNRRAASLSSAYSVRPQSGATVSTPLEWDELFDVTPRDFTIETIFDRLPDDPFAPVLSNRQSLDGAIEKLGVKASRKDISEGRVRKRVRRG
jgi:bifunctional non-homologous end joining protein LigD